MEIFQRVHSPCLVNSTKTKTNNNKKKKKKKKKYFNPITQIQINGITIENNCPRCSRLTSLLLLSKKNVTSDPLQFRRKPSPLFPTYRTNVVFPIHHRRTTSSRWYHHWVQPDDGRRGGVKRRGRRRSGRRRRRRRRRRFLTRR